MSQKQNIRELRQFASLKRLTYLGDIEFDQREFNGHKLGIAEDATMMRNDGTSEQYVIYIKQKDVRKHKRYITNLGVEKFGYRNAKEFAVAIFNNPDRYRNILGEDWRAYEAIEEIPRKAV